MGDAYEFDTDTAIEAVPGGFHAELTDRWDIAGRPNGGYLLSLATRALAGAAAGFPDPVSVTAHYLRPPRAGPVDIAVEEVRRGRGHATVMASLRQDGREFLRAMAIFTDLDTASGPTVVAGGPPSLPPPDACLDIRRSPLPAWPRPPEFFDRLDLRLAMQAGVGEPPGAEGLVGSVAGWVRLADGRDPDIISLALFADAYPPAVWAIAPSAWIPTLELTVHFRGRPAPGWLAGTFRTRFLVNGYLEEDGELWDSSGRLVALSRQLAIARG